MWTQRRPKKAVFISGLSLFLTERGSSACLFVLSRWQSHISCRLQSPVALTPNELHNLSSLSRTTITVVACQIHRFFPFFLSFFFCITRPSLMPALSVRLNPQQLCVLQMGRSASAASLQRGRPLQRSSELEGFRIRERKSPFALRHFSYSV